MTLSGSQGVCITSVVVIAAAIIGMQMAAGQGLDKEGFRPREWQPFNPLSWLGNQLLSMREQTEGGKTSLPGQQEEDCRESQCQQDECAKIKAEKSVQEDLPICSVEGGDDGGNQPSPL